MTTLNKAAKILVESGYGLSWTKRIHRISGRTTYSIAKDIDDPFQDVDLSLYADTLEGRQQADAVEDYLHTKQVLLLKERKQMEATIPKYKPKLPYNGRQKRLDRIKWCLDQLEKTSES